MNREGIETSTEIIPEELRNKVERLGSEVTPDQVDTYRKVRETEDRSIKLKKILAAWEGQNKEERIMRRHYANWLLTALFLQIILVNIAFFMFGFGLIKMDQWIAQSFIMTVFAEIVSMAFFIIKYLFPKVSADVLATLEKL